MKTKLLVDGKQCPFNDAGQPQIFYDRYWFDIEEDQTGEQYFMYNGQAKYIEVSQGVEPDYYDLLESFALCISLLAGLKMSEAIVNTPFGEKSVGSFIGNCEELHDKFKYNNPTTYIVASSHGENLEGCKDTFSAFRGEDGNAYSEALKEYNALSGLEGCQLKVLARVIKSTDY